MDLREKHVSPVIAGIDAPRCPLSFPRQFFWRGKRDEWRLRKLSEVGNGRHCEVVIKAARIVNPQCTPISGHCPEWMELGFTLFKALEVKGITTHEVFPSASYEMLEGENYPPVSLNFSTFRPGAKDMTDVCVAAFTVAEFENEGDCEMGSDGLGTIVIPPLTGFGFS